MPVGEEYLLTDQDELLIRQMKSFDIDDMGRPKSSAFKPGKSSHGAQFDFQLSTDRESVCGDAETITRKHQDGGLKSVSAWGVTVGEASSTGVSSYEDIEDQMPSHAIIDMKPIGTSQRKKAATKLARAARARGCLYPCG